jgi:hypothetical protein
MRREKLGKIVGTKGNDQQDDWAQFTLALADGILNTG